MPDLEIDGNRIGIKGKWLKVAAIHEEWWLDTELQDPEVCIDGLKKQTSPALRADIFTFFQQLPGSPPRFSYPMELLSVAAARTMNFKAWWESLPQETRKNVRRSQKRGVVVRTSEFDDDLIRGIASVNNESPRRQGIPNVHYGKSSTQVKKDHESFLDRSEFLCAYLGAEMIGYLKVVYKGDVAAVLNLAVMASHSDKRPGNALITAAVERCEKRKVAYLTYGLFNYGNKQDSPLREFKSRNGFEEFPTPKYYIPLTPWGRVCMKMKIHRGLLGILPSSAITLGISLRKTWYTLRSHYAGVAQR